MILIKLKIMEVNQHEKWCNIHEYTTAIPDGFGIVHYIDVVLREACCNDMATKWQPHGKHMATTWQPHGNHMAITDIAVTDLLRTWSLPHIRSFSRCTLTWKLTAPERNVPWRPAYHWLKNSMKIILAVMISKCSVLPWKGRRGYSQFSGFQRRNELDRDLHTAWRSRTFSTLPLQTTHTHAFARVLSVCHFQPSSQLPNFKIARLPCKAVFPEVRGYVRERKTAGKTKSIPAKKKVEGPQIRINEFSTWLYSNLSAHTSERRG